MLFYSLNAVLSLFGAGETSVGFKMTVLFISVKAPAFNKVCEPIV